MEGKSLRAAYGAHVQHEYVKKKFARAKGLKSHLDVTLPHMFIPSHPDAGVHPADMPPGKICIVGAGAAGLDLALMLQYLGFSNFDIWESSARVGGRCYTFRFNDKDCPHDYYDIGAMRLPKIAAMAPTFNLINYLNQNGQNVKLMDYVLSVDTNPAPSMYCNQLGQTADMKTAYAKFQVLMQSTLQAFQANFDAAFEDQITGPLDLLSTRQWLQSNNSLDYWTVENMETADTSTGLFDQAFTETICDYYDFNSADDTTGWQRVEQGMSMLTDAMQSLISTPSANWPGVKVNTNCQVTAMVDNGSNISVTVSPVGGTPFTTEYAAVFNTTTMGCLERMNTIGLHLENARDSSGNLVGPELLVGMRALSYDRASKVAIKFKTPWWNNYDAIYKISNGGVSSTDLSVSNIVYPSWNDGANTPTVLMVSYSWAQDATRIGSLIPNNNIQSRDRTDPVADLCLRNLAQLWTATGQVPPDRTAQSWLSFLQSQYIDHHAYAWSRDPNTAGAFALFGPGQFGNMYGPFSDPWCNGKFYFAGEAISAHHAWISGALDSSYTALLAYLVAMNAPIAQSVLKQSPFGGGEGQHPAEVDEKVLLNKVALAIKNPVNAHPRRGKDEL